MLKGPDQQGEHGWGASEALPERLCARDQWVVTEGKVPKFPSEGWNDPDRQFSFENAVSLVDDHGGQLGFVPHRQDPFVVIDLDDVGPPAEHPPLIEELVDGLGSYTELSVSGEGLHIITEGTRLPDRKHEGDLPCSGSIEVYDANQLFVLTGDQYGPYDAITANTEVLNEAQREWLPQRSDAASTTEGAEGLDLEETSETSLALDPVDIKRTIREYATDRMSSAQDALRLWESRPDDSLWYPSPSEADLALCSHLAFWCREDATLMDRCYSRSNREREKWDRVAYSDGRSYGDGTIQTAIKSNYETYSVGKYVVWE